jgi:hypothetical protein
MFQLHNSAQYSTQLWLDSTSQSTRVVMTSRLKKICLSRRWMWRPVTLWIRTNVTGSIFTAENGRNRFPKLWCVSTKLHCVTSKKFNTTPLSSQETILKHRHHSIILDYKQVKFVNKVANYPSLTQVKQLWICCHAYLLAVPPLLHRRWRVKDSDNLVSHFHFLSIKHGATQRQLPVSTYYAFGIYSCDIQRKLKLTSYDRRVTLHSIERAIHTVREDGDIQTDNWSGS